MNEKTKESKFLSAINDYAEKQKALINGEVEEFKQQNIRQATDAGIKDAYELIQREISDRKSALIAEYSAKESALREKLFAERERIANEVFKRAEEKLTAYTLTEAYTRDMLRFAAEARELIGESPCEVSLKESDMSMTESLRRELPQAVFKTDPAIIIGGMKVFCAEKGLMLDSTLDSGLKGQKRWFEENSGLKVVEG